MRSLALLLAAFGVLALSMWALRGIEPELGREPAPPRVPMAVEESAPPPHTRPTSQPQRAGPTLAIADRIDEWVARQRQQRRRNVGVQLARAAAFMKAEQFEAGLRCFNRVLRRDRDHPTALGGKAMALWQLGRRPEAVATHTALVAAQPDDVEVRFNYAVALAGVGRGGEAAAAYRTILDRRPDHGRSLYNLAALRQADGSLAESLRLWRRVTDMNHALPSAWFQRGTVATELNRHDEAQSCFRRVVALRPDDAAAHNNLGLALAALGRAAEAAEAYERAVDANPKLVTALCNWAELLLERHDPGADAKAKRLCRQALALQRENARARAVLARVP